MRRGLRSVDYEPGLLRRAWSFVLKMIGIRRKSVCPRCHGIGSVWVESWVVGNWSRVICRVCEGLGTTMEERE